MKPLRFSQHARQQMLERGATEQEVEDVIRSGEEVPAKRGRRGYRMNFQYNRLWGEKTYAIKQVMAIVAEEPDVWVIVTVFTFYF